jgi:ribonuclease P protein component
MGEAIHIIRKRADFVAANRGLRNARTGFVLLTLANQGLGKRFGVTVTKKIGNAVVRNRMKRRFRELLRAALPDQGLADTDHVLIGREGGVERDFATMREELAVALTRARDGKGDPARRKRR